MRSGCLVKDEEKPKPRNANGLSVQLPEPWDIFKMSVGIFLSNHSTPFFTIGALRSWGQPCTDQCRNRLDYQTIHHPNKPVPVLQYLGTTLPNTIHVHDSSFTFLGLPLAIFPGLGGLLALALDASARLGVLMWRIRSRCSSFSAGVIEFPCT